MTLALEVSGIRKSFGALRAVDGIDLTIERGEIVGYLGPNGAGKTTTLRIIAGLVRPDAGEVRIGGRNASDAAARESFGYLPGELALYGRMRASTLLDTFARFRRRRPPRLRGELLEVLGVGPDVLRRRVKFLSHGTKQKIGIVVAMQHDPDLLLLDEATLGLDPLVQESFREYLRTFAARGRTVLFSSHILGEVEAICPRVAILREGRIVIQQTIENLRAGVVRRMVVRFRGTPPDLASVRGVLRVEPREGETVVWCRGDLGPLLREIADAGVEDLVFPEPQLEDIFMSYYRGAEGG